MTVLSACNQTEEIQTEETIITTAVTSETTSQTLSEEELNALAQDMPEIVFVMSHHFDNPNIDGDETNILGYYITNTGEVKLYDFRTIAPDEIYEIPDVYDRLEEATCSEIHSIADNPDSSIIMSNNYSKKVPKSILLEDYKKLLLINEPTEYHDTADLDEITGHYRYYGIRTNDKGEREFILLRGWANNYKYNNSNPIAEELFSVLYSEFPNMPKSYYNYEPIEITEEK